MSRRDTVNGVEKKRYILRTYVSISSPISPLAAR